MCGFSSNFCSRPVLSFPVENCGGGVGSDLLANPMQNPDPKFPWFFLCLLGSLLFACFCLSIFATIPDNGGV